MSNVELPSRAITPDLKEQLEYDTVGDQLATVKARRQTRTSVILNAIHDPDHVTLHSD